jgi:phosphoserine phosphatase
MNSPEKNCLLYVHISMEDRPGILAEALQSVVRCQWNVLDIKQFVFNGLLNLSIFLDCNDANAIEPLRMALGEFEERSGLKISIHPWKKEMCPDEPYKHRSVVTLLGASIGSDVLLELTQTLASRDINILRIEQLDHSDQHVIEFVIGTRQTHSGVDVLDALVLFKEKFQVDLAVQDDTLFRRNKRLIVFDADMTFLQCEVIDEMGKLAGVGAEMAEITQLAMTGEMDFKEALVKRVKLLRGLSEKQLEELFERIPLTPGATDLVTILKYLGYKIAIVSGGFQFFIDKIRAKYGLDYGFANQLKIENGKVTGELEGEVIDALAKERILISLAEKEGFTLKQVVAVGDGANDIHMLACAGLGIAFNAKPIVQKHAHASINRSNLELILYFLGYNGDDLQELRSFVKRKESLRFPVS